MSAEDALREPLEQWRAGINAHDPARVAAMFTDDTIFQGLKPYSVGRAGVAHYYDSQPLGMTVSYRILESRRPAPDVAHGYLEATFAYVDGTAITLHIGVLVQRIAEGWRIGQYQASRID